MRTQKHRTIRAFIQRRDGTFVRNPKAIAPATAPVIRVHIERVTPVEPTKVRVHISPPPAPRPQGAMVFVRREEETDALPTRD